MKLEIKNIFQPTKTNFMENDSWFSKNFWEQIRFFYRVKMKIFTQVDRVTDPKA